MVGAAVLGGALVGGGAAIYGANKQSDAMESAAASQSAAEDRQLAQQQRQFEEQQRVQKEQYDQRLALNKPFYDIGMTALPELQYLTTGKGTPYDITSSPAYTYQQQQGEKAINRAAAARGGYGSTATVDQLGDFNQRLGASEVTNQYNRLLHLVNIGQSAANNESASSLNYANSNTAASQNYANSTSGIISNSANNLSNLQIQQGENQASMWSNLGALPMQGINAYQSLNQPQIPNYNPNPTTAPMTPQNTWLNPDTGQYVPS